MHESADGQSVVGVGESLLRGASASDLCLSCHADGARGVMGDDPLAPPAELGAGNFVFLYEDNLNDSARINPAPIPGHHAGHSIVAPGYGLFADPDYTVAPGGTYPAQRLGCTSCHDPHGNGHFRMLYGADPIQGGLATFLYEAPAAEGLPIGIPGTSEGIGLHTAYHSGMSWWCANCHGEYHDHDGTSAFDHSFNAQLGGDERTRYETYDGEASPNGGSAATAYLPEVSFEDPAATIDSTAGPSAAARVTCLTCHRAHASSSPRATRWDMRVFRLGEDGVLSGSYAPPNPYGDPNQLQLCLKCHQRNHAFGSNLSCAQCHMRSGGGVLIGN
jgi:hypothetical protein